MRSRGKGAFALACLSLLGLAATTGGGAPAGAASSAPGQGFLPENRVWEMVSPPDKNGGYVVSDSRRTQAAIDGEAVGFISLAAFGDAIGSGVSTEYIARRSTNANPGHNGWQTHAITPYQDPNTLTGALSVIHPFYPGPFSDDLQRGIYSAKSALTDDENVKDVLNLYRRTDLRSPGAGSYELITACPRCEDAGKLPPLPADNSVLQLKPILGGASPDLEHIVFESQQRLTTDTPAPFTGTVRLYEQDSSGAVRLAGKVPTGSASECAGGACAAAAVSVAGQGDTIDFLTPRTVSDGSDGHTRAFFTVPTEAGGAPNTGADGGGGNVYVRVDATTTAKLNATDERASLDAFARAFYWDATPDGTRVLFSSAQALTEDAPPDGFEKLYMYDTTKPASASDNLTLLTPPGEALAGAIGLGEDAEHVYFFAGDLSAMKVYVWSGGTAGVVAPLLGVNAISMSRGLMSTGIHKVLRPRQARVSPDGRHLLFSTADGSQLTGYDHGTCSTGFGAGGCRELYLYDAEVDSLQCVSCRPDGGPSAAVADREMSSTSVRQFFGGAMPGKHETRALSEDGRYVFFSTAQKLVPADTNGVADAYVFDSASEERRLLSSGQDSAPSWFLDATPDGSDAFFVTRERLSGWDVGTDYDLYDARVGGGFPEPSPAPPSCQGDACQPAPLELNDPTPGTASVNGAGDRRLGKPRPRCPQGKRRVKTRSGKSRCVKRSGKRAKAKRRAGR